MANERRELNFMSLDEVVAEVEQLAKGEVRTTGNHTFGQIIKHLALSHDMSTGELIPPPLPWYMKLMLTLMRSSLLKDKPLSPGVKLPANSESVFWPDEDFNIPAAIQHLKDSVQRYQTKGPLPKHPVFGAATKEQNLRLNCRHAALHLSFVHPN